VFAKWLKARVAPAQGTSRLAVRRGDRINASNVAHTLSALLLQVPERTHPIEFWIRAIVFAGLVVWGWHFIAMSIGELGRSQSFMHLVNLPFHEAGHIFFRPFGRTAMYLGGSLFQVMVPLILLVAFLLWHHNTFAAALMLWWAAQSAMDVAPYIADAREMKLTLLGGATGWEKMGMHDWQQILIELGCLACDDTLAAWVDGLAIVTMLAAMLWGAVVLWCQYRNLAWSAPPTAGG
jgi:hypothetical protein